MCVTADPELGPVRSRYDSNAWRLDHGGFRAFRLVGLSVQAGWKKQVDCRPATALPKKGVWNFEALKTPAFIEAGEFQTPFFG